MKLDIDVMDARPRDFTADTPTEVGTWIFLQGLATPFFAELARQIRRAGGAALRVNFCGGDPFFGGPEPQINYRGDTAGLPDFYRELFDAHAPRGLILFGDQRPVHRPAIALAQARGITVLCVEEGYLRPGWLTVEVGGTNAASALPRDADSLKALARALTAPGAPDYPVLTDFPARVRWDLQHKIGNIALGWRFPGYHTHRPHPMHREAAGWARRLLRRRSMQTHITRVWQRYIQEDRSFFLLPLQLNSDTQMRVHADVGGTDGFIRRVMASFAAEAPPDTHLLIKNHPLDNGVIDYHALVRNLSQDLKIGRRVDFIDGGDLDAMLDAAKGVVLVNSTVGLSALAAGVPVSAHGKALYDMPGLADQQDLSRFWHSPTPPEPETVEALLKILKTACMVEGDLFSAAGIKAGTAAILDIIQGRRPRLIRRPDGQTEAAPCP